MILNDGLDDVGDEHRRRVVSTFIDSVLRDISSNEDPTLSLAGITVLISSRIIGYEQAPLSTKVTRYVIEPLDDPSIAKLVRNWFIANCETIDDARRRTDEVVAQLLDPVNERLRSITENPFFADAACRNIF